jgi:type IV secretory pathway VirB2 component (pilin)
MKRSLRFLNEGSLAAALVVALPGLASAGSVPSGALPWDRPLDALAALLSGPIAHAFVALALTAARGIFGIQGNCEPARRLFKAGFATAVAIEAVKLLNYLLPY